MLTCEIKWLEKYSDLSKNDGFSSFGYYENELRYFIPSAGLLKGWNRGGCTIDLWWSRCKGRSRPAPYLFINSAARSVGGCENYNRQWDSMCGIIECARTAKSLYNSFLIWWWLLHLSYNPHSSIHWVLIVSRLITLYSYKTDLIGEWDAAPRHS
jgi:hypothetical protein